MGDITLPIPAPWAAVQNFSASYNYKLLDVLPSISEPGPAGFYTPRAQLWFEFPTITGAIAREHMELPADPISLDCIGPYDLGGLFVLDPGFVTGDIRLEGPQCGTTPTCFEKIRTLHDPANDFSDFRHGRTHVAAIGTSRVEATVVKEPTSTPTLWKGHYKMWLAGPNTASSSQHLLGSLVLLIETQNDPNNFNYVTISDHLSSGVVNQPLTTVYAGSANTHQNDHVYCFSDITVTLKNPDPNNLLIFDPVLRASGGYGVGAP
jgi:hypothetical protein